MSKGTADSWASSTEASPWTKVKEVPETNGVIIANKDMAEVLRKLADDGPEVFYRGEIAECIVDDMEKNGGFITLDDLNNYKATVTEPIYGNYRDHKIVTNPSPSGGITVIQILNILEEYDLEKMGHNITRGFSSYGDVSLVHGILVNRKMQTIQGGADPGGGGMAIYIPKIYMK
jgi:gamma-glutamyltranspeptidase